MRLAYLYYFLLSILIFSPDLIAETSHPPLFKEGETFPDYQQLIENARSPSRILVIAFSPDSGVLASGSDDNILRLWDTHSGQELTQLRGHSGSIRSVAFSPDKKMLASSSDDSTIRLWNTESGQESKQLMKHSETVWAVAFHPDPHKKMLASGSSDNTIRVWNIESGQEIDKFRIYSPLTKSLAFSPDGRILAAASSDHNVYLWDVETGRSLGSLKGHSDWVWSIAFSIDGKTLASGSDDHTIRLWNVESRQKLGQLEGHLNRVRTVAFSIDGKTLASGSDDHTVRLWDTNSGQEIDKLEDHFSTVTSVAFSPNTKMLASGSLDKTIHLWDVASGEKSTQLEGHYSPVMSIAFNLHRKTLASGSDDGTIRLWNTHSNREFNRLIGHLDSVNSVTFSLNGETLASGSDDNTVRLWDAHFGQEIGKLTGHLDSVNSVAFNPDGEILASGSDDSTVRLWNTHSGQDIGKLTGHSDSVNSVAFSPDGGILASGSDDNTVRLWDTHSGQEIGKLAGHSDWVNSVAFSPDGEILASGSDDNTVRLWDTHSGQEIGKLAGHLNSVTSVAFGTNGETLASSSFDKTIRLWDIVSGRELTLLTGHSDSVNSVAFGPNGKLLASGSNDNTVRLWNKHSGSLSWTLIADETGRWAGCRHDGQCWRYDDGSLMKRKNEKNQQLEPVLPKNLQSTKLQITSNLDSLIIKNSESRQINFSIRNIGQNRAYRIALNQDDKSHSKSQALFLKETDPLVTLDTGEEREFSTNVGVTGLFYPQGDWETHLNLRLTSANSAPVDYTLPVLVTLPSLAILSTSIESESLQIGLKNTGNQSLGESQIMAWLDNQQLDTLIRNEIQAGTDTNILFTLPSDIIIDANSRLKLVVRKTKFPMYEWIFNDLKITPAGPHWLLYLFITLILLTTASSFYVQRIFRHPLTVRLSTQPSALLETPLEQLPQARHLLRQTRRLKNTLSSNGIYDKRLQESIYFYNNNVARQRCNLLAQRLNAQLTESIQSKLDIFELTLPDNFILNMGKCLCVFPQSEQPALEVLEALRNTQSAKNRICLIISNDTEQQLALRREVDPASMWVIPSSVNLTGLLLSPTPLEQFAKLIANQVKVTHISPYQTRGGVAKESIFFGRAQLLSHILNRDPTNYFLIGGRQLGKSSLLKAIERHYQDNQDVDCHYLSLSDENTIAPLAKQLGLPDNADSRLILTTLDNKEQYRHRLLLIDEADMFVKQEAKHNYPILYQFRTLSEEGRCYFIFAGFWTLYQYASTVYQSPIKNFAETLSIGALESDACQELITQPMAALNISYESDELTQRIIGDTGGRANLIAIICNDILKDIDMTRRIIQADQIERAIDGTNIRDALGGWGAITKDPDTNRLDRIIVYATIQQDEFTLAELMDNLDRLHVNYEAEQLRQSLQRLELAFIVGREQNRYFYRVPLFQRMIRNEEPERLLQNEIASSRVN